MINIEIIKSSHKIKITGHAYYAEKGKDIVCAAVSMLMYTLAESIKRNEFMLLCKPRIKVQEDEESINAYVQCIPKRQYEANIETIYQTILNGLELLAEGYPENVQIKVI